MIVSLNVYFNFCMQSSKRHMEHILIEVVLLGDEQQWNEFG